MGKTIVSVASSAWNLAGSPTPEKPRQDFLKSVLLTSILSGNPTSKALRDSYINGPRTRMNSFGHWLENGYYTDLVGETIGTLSAGDSIDTGVLAGEIIPTEVGGVIEIQTASIGMAQFWYWADQFVCLNHPELVDTTYEVDMNETLNKIYITYEDTSIDEFTPTDFQKDSRYLYVSYRETSPPTIGSVDTGATIIVGDPGDFPSLVDWTEVSISTTPHTETLTVTTDIDITYSDATPPSSSSSSTSSSEDWDEVHAVYEKWETTTSTESTMVALKSILYMDTVATVTEDVTVDVVNEDIGGGVIKTTTTTVTTEVITYEYSYRIDTQEYTYVVWKPLQVFIYRENTGNTTLDEMFNIPVGMVGFYPFIPLRLNNLDVKETYPDLYVGAKRALRHAINAKYDKVLEQVTTIEDVDGNKIPNTSLVDMDYIYVVFGVALNTVEKAGVRYIYKFFQSLNLEESKTSVDYDAWKAAHDAANDSWDAWVAYVQGWESNGDDPVPPTRGSYPPMPKNSLNLSSTNPAMNYRIQLDWNFIEEEFGSGYLDEANHSVGDWWITKETPDSIFERGVGSEGEYTSNYLTLCKFHVNHQITADTWERLIVRGLVHTNMIYGGRSVKLNSDDALSIPFGDPDYEESGLIIPMHREVFKEIGMIAGTQLAACNSYILINCYATQKLKWYQTTWFQFVLFVVIVVVTIVFPPAAGAGGILGSSATVGGTLGFVGTTAIIVGTIINYIAAILVMQTIGRYAVKWFGKEIGTIIQFLSFIVIEAITMGTTNPAELLSSFMQPQNLVLLTTSAINSYSQYLNLSTEELSQQLVDMQDEFKKKYLELEKLTAELTGGTSGILTSEEITKAILSRTESLDSFLQRTLLTGDDLHKISLTLIENFPEITTSTDLPEF